MPWPDPKQPSIIDGPDGSQFIVEARQGNLAGFGAALASMRQGRWDDKQFLIERVIENVRIDLLDGWCQAQPENAIAFLLRGFRRYRLAWERRDARDNRGYDDNLAGSRADLMRAAQLDPEDPIPCIWLMAATVDGEDDNAVEMHFREALRRDPGNLEAHFDYMNFIAPKWSGDEEISLAFARQTSASLPPGHELHMLVLAAHWEAFVHAGMNEEGSDAGSKARKQVVTKAVKAEVKRAWENSLAHPAFRPQRSSITRRNLAARWFWLASDRDSLKRELSQIGNAYTDSYWNQGPDGPRAAFFNAADYASSPFAFVLDIPGPVLGLGALFVLGAIAGGIQWLKWRSAEKDMHSDTTASTTTGSPFRSHAPSADAGVAADASAGAGASASASASTPATALTAAPPAPKPAAPKPAAPRPAPKPALKD